jgi:hypothetical protein
MIAQVKAVVARETSGAFARAEVLFYVFIS